MINATAPNIPNQDVVFDAITPENPKPTMKVDPLRWYKYLNDTEEFLIALRNAPLQVEQADLAGFLRKLIKAKMQPGVQVWIPLFNHLLRYDGTKFTFAPGDAGSGYRVTFASPPTADGWKLCDGTANVPFLLADGTLGTETLPNTAGLYFRL